MGESFADLTAFLILDDVAFALIVPGECENFGEMYFLGCLNASRSIGDIVFSIWDFLFSLLLLAA